MLKLYEHVVCMVDNRWPKQLTTWSLGGRRRRRQPKVNWEEEIVMIMEKRNLAADDTTNWQLWRLTTSTR